MGQIKDNLHLGKGENVTLTPSEVEYLQQMNADTRQVLDMLQQRQAAAFLRFVAVNRFEYAPACELRFNLDLTKTEGNLEIINMTK